MVQQREEVLRTHRDDLPDRLLLSQQKEFKRIKNLVIQVAVRLGGSTVRCSCQQMHRRQTMSERMPILPSQGMISSMISRNLPALFSFSGTCIPYR